MFRSRQVVNATTLFLVLTQSRVLGWQLGSDPEVQVATVVNNHLTSGIMKYFGEAFRCVVPCTSEFFQLF